MANADLIRRMHSTLDAYERGEISSIEVENTIPFYVDGLERLPYDKVKEAGTLCYRLVVAQDTDGVEEFIDQEQAAAVLLEFRRFVDSLPANS